MNIGEIRAVAIFVVLAFGLSWAIALPLWFGNGLNSPWFGVSSILMMFTPGIGALLVVLFVERPVNKIRALGLWPLKPVGRLLRYLALGIFVPAALVLVALPMGALFGVFPADFTNFSGFEEQIRNQISDVVFTEIGISTGKLVALQLVALPIGAFLNLIPCLGEELGWRGWLLPRLMPLGTVSALLISGGLWGLWHAPLVLLGYNYTDAPGWLGMLMMTGMCILVGAVFGWLRLRSESVWPAALAHGSLNASAGSYLLFAMAGEHINTIHATILGWTGWLVPFILVVVLLATKQFKPAIQK